MQNRKKKEREKFIPEKLGTLFKVFPHMGTVTKPIHVSTLVISGGKDCYVSCDDAEKTARFHGACHHHYRDLSHSDLLSDINVVSGIKKWVGEES